MWIRETYRPARRKSCQWRYAWGLRFQTPVFANSIMDAEGDFVRIAVGHWHDAPVHAGTSEVMNRGAEAKSRWCRYWFFWRLSHGYQPRYQEWRKFMHRHTMAMQPNGIFIVFDCPDIYELPFWLLWFNWDEFWHGKELRAGFADTILYCAFHM